MAIFSYTAKNEHGETIKGKVEARTPEIAANALSGRGLFVISVSAHNESTLASINDFISGVSGKDIVNVTRQLATMITAGLPLSNGLSILAQQSKDQLADLLNDILRDIEGGSTFSQALAKKEDTFSRVYIQLVKAGETGGVLDKVLQRLADTLEKQQEFRGKTKGALIYPAIVIIAMIIVAFIMMVFVVPKLTELYTDFGSDLPLPTQILIGTSNLAVRFWYIFVFGAVGGTMFFLNWRQSEAGQKALDAFFFKVPVVKDLRAKVIITEFARTMSLLLSAGVSLLEALEIVTEALDSYSYRQMMRESREQVEKGVPLSTAMGSYEAFPPLLSQMIAVGEETGKLDEVLMKLAIYYETESEQAVKNLTTAIEPAIMIVLAVGVGLLVVSIILPIYNLTSQF